MNVPHVKKLYYKVITGEGVDYKNAAAISEETQNFRMVLDGETVIFEMKGHFSTEQEARAVADEYLKEWDILIGIEHNPDELTFKFDRAEIIDLAPSPHVVELHTHITAQSKISEKLKFHLSKRKYPSRPKGFRVSPDVETMYLRYKAYKKNRESLTTMAYMCLTVLETSTGEKRGNKTRIATGGKYNIQYDVLHKLGGLTAKGNEKEARKAPKGKKYISLTPVEKQWIEEVVKSLIRRMGEYAYDPNAKFRRITMHDFPSI